MSNVFYDKLSDSYERMTRFEDRLERDKPVIRRIIDRFNIGSAVDAGCGSGLHSILLAEEGVETIGIDLSARMISSARKHAEERGANVTFYQADFSQAADVVDEPADVLLCLGNSVPHILDSDEMERVLRAFRKSVRDGGTVLIQLLNYDRVLEHKDRIVGIHKVDDVEYIRFYDFMDNLVRFNILEIDWTDTSPKNRLLQTTLRPWTADELYGSIRKADFTDVELYGDLGFSEYIASESSNLVVVARS